MRETRQSGSEGGVRREPHPYPYRTACSSENLIPACAGMTRGCGCISACGQNPEGHPLDRCAELGLRGEVCA